MTWPTDFNAVCLNEIPLTISVSHTHTHSHARISTCTLSLWPSQCFPPALLTGVAPTRRHTDNRSQTHTQSHTQTRPYRAFFPILGLHNGHFVHIPPTPHAPPPSPPPNSPPQPLPSTPHWLPAHPSLNGRLCKWGPTTAAPLI